MMAVRVAGNVERGGGDWPPPRSARLRSLGQAKGAGYGRWAKAAARIEGSGAIAPLPAASCNRSSMQSRACARGRCDRRSRSGRGSRGRARGRACAPTGVGALGRKFDVCLSAAPSAPSWRLGHDPGTRRALGAMSHRHGADTTATPGCDGASSQSVAEVRRATS